MKDLDLILVNTKIVDGRLFSFRLMMQIKA